MFQSFKDLEAICAELEKLRIDAQTGEIIYHQKGENLTADRFAKLEHKVEKALVLLRETE